jgi:hypothetical protein
LMSWVLIYIVTNFLAPIPCISLEIVNFLSKFLPKSMNISTRISRKSPSWKKPALDRLKPAHWLKPAQDRLKPAYPRVNAIAIHSIRSLFSHRSLPRSALLRSSAPAAHLPPPRAAPCRHHHTPATPASARPTSPRPTRSPGHSSASTPRPPWSKAVSQLSLAPAPAPPHVALCPNRRPTPPALP